MAGSVKDKYTAVRIERSVLKCIKEDAAKSMRSVPQQIAWMCHVKKDKKGL